MTNLNPVETIVIEIQPKTIPTSISDNNYFGVDSRLYCSYLKLTVTAYNTAGFDQIYQNKVLIVVPFSATLAPC